MDVSTFEYLKPTDKQLDSMQRIRYHARVFANMLEAELPMGADKDHVLRSFRTAMMWANVAITRDDYGTPRP